MYFKSTVRKNPATGKLAGYYRLIESYRNLEGRICHRTILNIGFMDESVRADQLLKIQQHLTGRYEQKQTLFEEDDPVVINYVEDFWQRIVSGRRLDIVTVRQQHWINAGTMQHSNVREVGAEWMSHATWNKLQLTEFLLAEGFSEVQAQLAATQVISRAVYPFSELRTTRWIKENSAITELTGYDLNNITKDKLYTGALDLYNIKDKLEQHLSKRTNELFDLEDKIILYDLTNTYFEGEKRNSALAKFGRSKEKRNDARLVVLALVVNIEGFIKYSAIHEGNIADCNTLGSMIDKLSKAVHTKASVVVLDAGIATEENLTLLSKKGYKYLCVSRSKLRDYEVVKDRLTTLLETKSKQQIQLKAVSTSRNTDYYLEVSSEAKALKEAGMKSLFEERFEESLRIIEKAIHSKKGIRQTEKVQQRIGRAKQKYPSVQHYYNIAVRTDEQTKNVIAINWEKDDKRHEAKQNSLGVYFLRTNLAIKDEVVIWNIYNTIREIEAAFRTLKADLDLRPIYHKNDQSTMAHLHLGLLAYWLVNTIRYQLKAKGINSCWSEIVRIGNTQKMVTTTGQNTNNQIISVRKCSQPTEKLKAIYEILQIRPKAFHKRKSVVHKPELKKTETLYSKEFTPV
jgi:transposase